MHFGNKTSKHEERKLKGRDNMGKEGVTGIRVVARIGNVSVGDMKVVAWT